MAEASLPATGHSDDVETLLGAFLSLSPDAAVVVDTTGTIRAVNVLAESMFGYDANELEGAPLEILLPEPIRDRHVHLRRGYAAAPRPRPMGAGLDLAGRRKDGTVFPVDISLAPLTGDPPDLVVAAVRDVTRQRESERLAARLAAIVTASDAAILSTTTDRVLTSWNPAAELLFGYTEAEVLGRTVDLLVPPELRDDVADWYARVARGDHVGTVDTERRRADGSTIPVAVSVSSIRDDTGTVIGFCEVQRDQTERQRIRAELAGAQTEAQVWADRDRIARDLHDRVIQRIFAAGMGFQAVSALVTDPDARARMQSLVEDLDEAVREIRTSIFTLRTHVGDQTGLRSRLLAVGEQTGAVLGFSPTLDFRGPVDLGTPPEVAEQVVAVVREALANVAEHAEATSVVVEVRVGADDLSVIVTDNGRGPRPPTDDGGLANLAERAAELDGHVVISPAATGGTRVEWTVTLPR
jgi:PAS domain S-box-containing protein